MGGGAITTCDPLCTFDTAACLDSQGQSGTVQGALCGNGILDPGEDCDWHATLDN